MTNTVLAKFEAALNRLDYYGAPNPETSVVVLTLGNCEYELLDKSEGMGHEGEFKRLTLAELRELVHLAREMIAEAAAAKEALEQLRPVWAQGFTSDSEAAQANGNALAQLWAALGVTNQTAAMERLRELVGE